MIQLISSLQKQNFDLKMELFHRRERMTALEDELEQARELEADNAEMQEVNEQLLEELEKRDSAIEEAVGIICELEEKVETLESRVTETSPSTLRPQDIYDPPTAHHEIPSSPPAHTDCGNALKTPTKDQISHAGASRLVDMSTPRST